MFPFANLQLAVGGLEFEWLLAGPGGGGGASGVLFGRDGSGAGAGGFKQGKQRLDPGTAWAVVIGAPGHSDVDGSTDGGISSFGPFTVHGGGHGADAGIFAGDGGSGGGGGSPGTGILGEGFNGGSHAGGGAGGPGFLFTPGPGVTSDISGATVTYCVGGPEAGVTAAGPGSGGAGAALTDEDAPGDTGRASELVVSYPGTTSRATGGTITHIGGRTQHTFTASGTFTVLGGAPPPPPPTGGVLDFEDPEGTGVGLAGGIL